MVSITKLIGQKTSILFSKTIPPIECFSTNDMDCFGIVGLMLYGIDVDMATGHQHITDWLKDPNVIVLHTWFDVAPSDLVRYGRDGAIARLLNDRYDDYEALSPPGYVFFEYSDICETGCDEDGQYHGQVLQKDGQITATVYSRLTPDMLD